MSDLLDLWVQSWSEAIPEIDFEARRDAFTQMLADLADTGYRIVGHFDDQEKLRGFFALKPETGHLDQICIAASRKGSGLAQTLLDRARAMSPGFLTLSVNRANPRAIRFYENNGFLRTGEGFNPRSGLPIFHYRWQR